AEGLRVEEAIRPDLSIQRRRASADAGEVDPGRRKRVDRLNRLFAAVLGAGGDRNRSGAKGEGLAEVAGEARADDVLLEMEILVSIADRECLRLLGDRIRPEQVDRLAARVEARTTGHEITGSVVVLRAADDLPGLWIDHRIGGRVHVARDRHVGLAEQLPRPAARVR